MPFNRLKDYTDQGVASVLIGLEMPDGNVSDIAQVNRSLGAAHMLTHLLGDKWGANSHEIMGEFIGRLVANAERQGVVIDYQTIAPPRE